MSNQFYKLCINGHLGAAKKYYKNNKNNICDINEIFEGSCRYGKLNIAKWLYSLGNINIHAENEYVFRWSCYKRQLHVAQWLYSLGGVNIHANYEDAFISSCINNNINIVQWLYSLGNIDIHALRNQAFISSCTFHHIEIIKWLLLIDRFDNDMVDSNLPMQCYDYAFSLGYLPTNKMILAYTEYKSKIKKKIIDKKEDGPINIFELEYLIDIIILYV